ncbi:leucine-rich repeat-containing protein 72 [Micropterus dolomieu]|uniref:leucine-rich repeat-containing protein 72 n=1 Tax=Micropterus dolomieu TaxID=147949 RepID=UPI001E8EB172|nr:leucine-rich repeat-containing protein 72 [Micropterus dolomieu]XP_045900210.1 leucine-rich repeat-containing protein 72 [Micropterus dolomieu]
MEAAMDIKDSLQRCGIRRDVDVCQLSLATKKLTSVPDLSRFRFLRELRLNNNKIRELSCRSLNCCLTELYLHNNNIKSISGALNHLTCLRLIFLHNNQIRGLEDTMHELRRIQQLQTATFFLNPISHEPGYRHHVIHCLPSIQVLDGKEVKSKERRWSFQMHNQERHRVLQTVAFCRRAT